MNTRDEGPKVKRERAGCTSQLVGLGLWTRMPRDDNGMQNRPPPPSPHLLPSLPHSLV